MKCEAVAEIQVREQQLSLSMQTGPVEPANAVLTAVIICQRCYSRQEEARYGLLVTTGSDLHIFSPTQTQDTETGQRGLSQRTQLNPQRHKYQHVSESRHSRDN